MPASPFLVAGTFSLFPNARRDGLRAERIRIGGGQAVFPSARIPPWNDGRAAAGTTPHGGLPVHELLPERGAAEAAVHQARMVRLRYRKRRPFRASGNQSLAVLGRNSRT